jgi:hypothetical protein
VRVFEDGAWVFRPGWGITIRANIEELGYRWLSLCETPDLDVIPQRFLIHRSAIFRAGLELPILHLGLVAASIPVRFRLLLALTQFARPFRAVANLLARFGTDRGGMVVEASGIGASGTPIQASWTLVAETGHGLFIPALPALAAIRALNAGRLRRPGAGICAGVLLDWIEEEFKPYRIRTRIRIDSKGRLQ